jgi:hypothetical protein
MEKMMEEVLAEDYSTVESSTRTVQTTSGVVYS